MGQGISRAAFRMALNSTHYQRKKLLQANNTDDNISPAKAARMIAKIMKQVITSTNKTFTTKPRGGLLEHKEQF